MLLPVPSGSPSPALPRHSNRHVRAELPRGGLQAHPNKRHFRKGGSLHSLQFVRLKRITRPDTRGGSVVRAAVQSSSRLKRLSGPKPKPKPALAWRTALFKKACSAEHSNEQDDRGTIVDNLRQARREWRRVPSLRRTRHLAQKYSTQHPQRHTLLRCTRDTRTFASHARLRLTALLGALPRLQP